jgi:hypothetical protein
MLLIPSDALTAVNVTVAFVWIDLAMQPGFVPSAKFIIMPER